MERDYVGFVFNKAQIECDKRKRRENIVDNIKTTLELFVLVFVVGLMLFG